VIPSIFDHISSYLSDLLQVRREADMQIREAEHRHRAELAAEQERVREAHEMVELIQSGMPRSWTCPVGTLGHGKTTSIFQI
jgi:signal recognition particle GTPase